MQLLILRYNLVKSWQPLWTKFWSLKSWLKNNSETLCIHYCYYVYWNTAFIRLIYQNQTVSKSSFQKDCHQDYSKILKYWVGVQRGQSYLMGRMCLFSLGWPTFSDGVTIKIPHGADVLLHPPALHPIFSYWFG